jgi:putative endonuclease
MAGRKAAGTPRLARNALGAYGERVAARHLVEDGMEVLDRNWRCRDGELDLVARDGDALVFCEVKTRRTVCCGVPAEAVVPAKARRIRRLAAQWMSETGAHAPEVRFDVVAVLAAAAGAADIEHTRGAF